MNLAFLLSALSSAKCISKPGLEPWGAYCTPHVDNEEGCKKNAAYCSWDDSHHSDDDTPTIPDHADVDPKKPNHNLRPPQPKPDPPVHPVNGVVKLSNSNNFQKCVINIGYDNPNGSYDDVDIANHYENHSDPFAFYTDDKYPGVTLIGKPRADHCNWALKPTGNQVPFTWTATEEQCILNGSYGYFNPQKETGATGNSYLMNKNDRVKWSKASQSLDNLPLVSGIPGEDRAVKVAIGFGHGVLNSKPGEVALVRHRMSESEPYNYAAIMMVGTRAWSFEISGPANTHLASDNYGGTCHIPDVLMLSQTDVAGILANLDEK